MTQLSPELSMVKSFLARCLPFAELEDAELDKLAAGIEITYFKKGEVLRPESASKHLNILRSGAVEIISSDGELLDRLGEQESFNLHGLAQEDRNVRAVLIDDSLFYQVSLDALTELRRESRHIDRYFQGQLARRMRRAARHTTTTPQILTPLSEIISQRLISIESAASIREAATLMTEMRVSSLLIVQNAQTVGIVTDRDIRSRSVAAGLAGEIPVSHIMTPDPVMIRAEKTVFDAMVTMSELAVHHLPVLNDTGNVVNVLTTSDLVRNRRRDPVFLLQDISRKKDVTALAETAAILPSMVLRLVADGVRANQVSRFLCAIIDRITSCLLNLAEQELGPPPVHYAWLAFGSQGRHEIALGGDQDNALVIDDRMREEDVPYFESLARFVCDGLNACGYRYCPGDVMATNPSWRITLAKWKETVNGWVRSPTDDAVMRVSIFFDIRCIAGEKSLADQLQRHMLDTASGNSIFLASLARNALCNRPPLGFFRRFVLERNGEHRDQLDLKHRGIVPVIDAARVHAIANGVAEVNTIERLAALGNLKKLALADVRNYQDALNFILQVRLEHQCAQLENGQPTDNYINPQQLGSLARKQLRDAFSIIHAGQESVAMTFSAGTF